MQYHENLVSEIVSAGDRHVLVHAPLGSGRSLLIRELSLAFNKRVLVLTDRLENSYGISMRDPVAKVETIQRWVKQPFQMQDVIIFFEMSTKSVSAASNVIILYPDATVIEITSLKPRIVCDGCFLGVNRTEYSVTVP